MSGPSAVPAWETMAVWAEPDDCGCTYEEGCWFVCARHQSEHPHDGTRAPGCRACQEETR